MVYYEYKSALSLVIILRNCVCEELGLPVPKMSFFP